MGEKVQIIDGSKTLGLAERTTTNLRQLASHPEDHHIWRYAPFTRAECVAEIERRVEAGYRAMSLLVERDPETVARVAAARERARSRIAQRGGNRVSSETGDSSPEGEK